MRFLFHSLLSLCVVSLLGYASVHSAQHLGAEPHAHAPSFVSYVADEHPHSHVEKTEPSTVLDLCEACTLLSFLDDGLSDNACTAFSQATLVIHFVALHSVALNFTTSYLSRAPPLDQQVS